MKKKIIAILITVSIVSCAHSTVCAGSFLETEAETTPAVTETQAETPAETVPAETPVETESVIETTPEVTTESETEAPTETTAVMETSEETKSSDPTVLTTESIANAKVSETVSSDIELYTKESETLEKPVAKQEKKKDTKVTIAIIFMFLGLALGVAGGTFLGWYLHKRKVNMEHDELYAAIKYGEVHEVVVKDRQEKEEQKKKDLAKKREERKQQMEKARSEKAAKRAEAERQKKLQQYKKMQQDLGLAPLENEPEIQEVPKEEKESILDKSIAFLEKQRDKRKDKEEKTTTEEKQPEPDNKPQPKPHTEEDEFIRAEDMEYGGEWKGETYYYDPKDPEGMPFKIVNGKKEFFD